MTAAACSAPSARGSSASERGGGRHVLRCEPCCAQPGRLHRWDTCFHDCGLLYVLSFRYDGMGWHHGSWNFPDSSPLAGAAALPPAVSALVLCLISPPLLM